MYIYVYIHTYTVYIHVYVYSNSWYFEKMEHLMDNVLSVL